MYGLGDEISGQAEEINKLRKIIEKVYRYVKKLPNENKLEKELILDLMLNYKD